MSDVDNQLLVSLRGLTDAVNNQSAEIREQGKVVNEMQVELASLKGKFEGLEDRVQDAKDFRHEIRDLLNQRLGMTDSKILHLEKDVKEFITHSLKSSDEKISDLQEKQAELEKGHNEMKTEMATRKGKDSILSLIWSGLLALFISVVGVLFGRQ